MFKKMFVNKINYHLSKINEDTLIKLGYKSISIIAEVSKSKRVPFAPRLILKDFKDNVTYIDGTKNIISKFLEIMKAV
jgi:hypothetical protein